MQKKVSLILALCLSASLFLPTSARAAAAEVGYLPGVTKEMTTPAYWTELMEEPDKLLATAQEIARINAAALATEGSNMHDLKNLDETFDGVARSEALQKGAASDADYYLGWTYGLNGKKLTKSDFERIAANAADPNAKTKMKVRYAVAVRRTELVTFPYDGRLLPSPGDYDFDYQALVGVRVNEPLVLFTSSADGAFYQAYSSCCSGWVRAEDVAVCKDKKEWLSAWDIPAAKRLVFCGDRIFTEYSRAFPELSNRLITMGTVLERMDAQERGALVMGRAPLHNYSVYLPLRTADGGYTKKPVLINAREKVSEDYLPLTPRNLADVALASLGDAYGWGGGLRNEDCTSLNRCIYCCFGLDLPRNGSWQWPLAMPKADATYMCTEEKEALLDALPLGTLLNLPGHQMMYLGKAEGAYYVVSAAGSYQDPETGKRQRTRDVQINALDIRSSNGQTWLDAINRICLPWQYLAEGAESPMPKNAWYHEGTAYCLKNKLIDAYEDGYFRPDETATRATIVEAIWRAAGKPEAGKDATGFSDVKKGASYEQAVLWAKEQGIAAGMSGKFVPNGTLTREQLAVMLCRALAPEAEGGAAGLAGFDDAGKISDWAYGAMGWAVRTGLIGGKSKQTIAPQDAVTRAELAVILQRAGA